MFLFQNRNNCFKWYIVFYFKWLSTWLFVDRSIKWTASRAVADPEGSRGSLEPTLNPRFLNILWKWNNLVSVRPNYFIFMGCLSKKQIKSAKRTPHTFIQSENHGSAPGGLIMAYLYLFRLFHLAYRLPIYLFLLKVSVM